MSLRRRLEQLEVGDPEPCPTCVEWLGDEDGPAEYEVVWGDSDLYEMLGGDEHPVHGRDVDPVLPEYCPECGHQLIYTVTWMDLEEQA